MSGFFHSSNTGKGAAIPTGLKYASGDIVIFQDADLEYDPEEYFSLIETIEKGVADVVYGSRLWGDKPQRVYLFWHKLGNRFIALVAKYVI